jgi:hypothetical protein
MANFKSAILTTGAFSESATTAGQTLIAPVDVKNEDRISFQFINKDSTGTNKDTIKVYGRLAATSGSLGAVAEWTQIGDNIVVSGSTSALKSIATTGLMWVGVTIDPTATHATQNHDWAMLRQA